MKNELQHASSAYRYSHHAAPHHIAVQQTTTQRTASFRPVAFSKDQQDFLVICGAAAAGRQGREGKGGSGGWVGALHKSRGGGREGGYVRQIRYYRVEELDKVRGKCE